MADTADLEFDPEFAAVVKRNPTAALVIEVRYLRRDVDALDKKVDGMGVKQCPCNAMIDLGKKVATMEGEGTGREKTGSNLIAYLGVFVSIAAVLITLYVATKKG